MLSIMKQSPGHCLSSSMDRVGILHQSLANTDNEWSSGEVKRFILAIDGRVLVSGAVVVFATLHAVLHLHWEGIKDWCTASPHACFSTLFQDKDFDEQGRKVTTPVHHKPTLHTSTTCLHVRTNRLHFSSFCFVFAILPSTIYFLGFCLSIFHLYIKIRVPIQSTFIYLVI